MLRITLFCSGVCLCMSFMVLLGWQFDVEVLKRPLPGVGGMNPTTAFCFILSSTSLLLLVIDKKFFRILSYLMAFLCFVIAAYRLTEGWFLYTAHADQTLFLEKLREEANSSAQRMSPNGAFTFILITLSLFLLARQRVWAGQIIAAFALMIAWFTVLGYLYRVPEFYGLLNYLPMSLYTAICFVLLSVALFALHPQRGVVKEINSNMLGGRIARIFVPIVILVPVVFGYLRLLLHWNNTVSTEFGVALLTVGITIFFVLMIIFNIILLNQQDALRRQSEESVKQTNKVLKERNEEVATLHEEMVAANEEMTAANEELTMMNEQLHSANEKIKEQADIIVEQKDEHLNRALDSTHVIIWSIDMTGNGKDYMSRSAEKISGIPVKEFLTQRDTWNRLIVAEDFYIYNAALKRLDEKGYTDAVFRLRDKDGAIRWIRLQLKIVRDKEGKPLRQEGMIVDITSLKESELALQKERTLLRALIDNIPDYIFVKDQSLRYIINNKANLDLIGALNEEDSLTKTSKDYFGAVADSFHKDDLKVLANGESILNKEEVIQLGDHSRIVLTTKVPLRDGTGAITGIIGISRDVTERRKSDQLLNQYRERLDIIFQSTLEKILLLDNEGRVVLFNNALEKFITDSTGKKPVIGSYVWDTTVPERAEIAKNLFEQALAGKSFTTDAFVKLPGGMVIHELRYQPIYREGEVKFVMIISLDVTERRNQENSVRKSEANLRAIFDSTQDSFILLDNQFKILTFNESFRMATSLHEELKEGADMVELVPTDRHEIFRGYLMRARQGEAVVYEIKGEANEEVTWHQVVISPVKDRHNHVLGLCITSHNLTEHKKAEEERNELVKQLIEQNNDLLQFSFIASHNLRGPVASMLGLLNLLHREQLPAEVSTLLTFIGKSVQRLDQVIGDLSQILSLRRDDLQAKEWVSIRDLMEVITTSLQAQITESGAVIHFEDEQAKAFFSIKTYLNSILYNLISNSIKYRSATRPLEIEVKTFKDETSAGFSVRDNGQGLDLEKYGDKVFKLYQRFHLDVEGKGIGLYITYTQAQILKGTLQVQSSPDNGAMFILRFTDTSMVR